MDSGLGPLIEKLVHSYHEVGGINLAESANLPSKRTVGRICEELLQILFPGYHDANPIAASQLELITMQRVSDVSHRLEAELCKALRTRSGEECPETLSAKDCRAFLDRLPSIRAMLATDVQAAFEGDPAASGRDEVILAYPFLEATAIQRCAHVLYELNVPLLPRVMTEWAHARTGMDIHPGAVIGSHFFIDHGTGVVIGETAAIGSHVKLYQGVSLTARSLAGGQQLRGTKRHPTVEDNVTVYAGTTIMGGETVIGAGTTIGANVFLTQSVPPNSLVYYEETQLRILPKKSRHPAAGADAPSVVGG